MSSSLKASPTCTVKILANKGFETARIHYEVSFERFATLKGWINTKEFSLPTNNEIAFYVGFQPDKDGITSFHLSNFSSFPSPGLRCNISSWLMEEDGHIYMNRDKSYTFVERRFFEIFQEDRANILNKKNLLPDGILTFCCEITFEMDNFSQKVVSTAVADAAAGQKLMDNQLQLLGNLRKLLSSGAHADFAFTVGKRRFPVHRAILHAQSTYFSAMFCHPDLKEYAAGSSVAISDIEADLFAELLQYLYIGEVPAIDNNVSKGIELLVAADRFQLDSLKSIVESQLSSEKMLTVESMFTLLLAADTYNAPTLKAKAVEFIGGRATTKDILTGLFENKLFISGGDGEKGESKSVMGVIQDLMKMAKE